MCHHGEAMVEIQAPLLAVTLAAVPFHVAFSNHYRDEEGLLVFGLQEIAIGI